MNSPVTVAESQQRKPDWIGVDWGTSNLRVWGMDGDGNMLASATSSRGMGSLAPDEYEDHLLSLTASWLPEPGSGIIPVLVCGMAGARQGWREAAYRQVPCNPVTAGAGTRVETRDERLAVSIIPGLAQASPADVMRGEETQLAGLISAGLRDATVCLPGTHSKWVRLGDGCVDSFRTFMTGELFAAIATSTILKHSLSVDDPFERDAFVEAFHESLDAPAMLTGQLFSIRARSLISSFGDHAASRLSGLLIGLEMAATKSWWHGREVQLAGTRPLVDRYALAVEQCGATPVVWDGGDLVLDGLKLVRSLTEENHQ